MTTSLPRRMVCVVWDGLRPDLIAPDVTPTLWRLARGGVWHERARSVFPSETRVATSAFSTGSYPGKHGIAANNIFAPAVAPFASISTGEASQLQRLTEAEGRTLLTTTLGEVLRDAGGVLAAASAGSSGNAFLINPGAWREETGYVVNWAITLPESAHAEVRQRFGGPPVKSVPNAGPNGWVTRIFCEWLIPEVVARREPAAGVLWLSEPDVTLHARGFGHADLLAALKGNDDCLARVLAAMTAAGMRVEGPDANANLLVLSDHGHTTLRRGARRLSQEVLGDDWRAEVAAGDIVFAAKAIWVAPALRSRLPALAERLQRHPAVGPVFARNPTDMPGILPLSAVHHGGERAPDLLFSPDWNDAVHTSGLPGHTWAADAGPEITSHGSLSPFDMRTTFVAAGASFRQGVTSAVPVGVVDAAPTLLHLLGVPAPAAWDGRAVTEAMRDGPDPASVSIVEGSIGGTTKLDNELREQRVHLARVGTTVYVDHGTLSRLPLA